MDDPDIKAVDGPALNLRGVAGAASVVACAVVPVGILAVLLPGALQPATDYPQFHQAAQAILDGRDPYRIVVDTWSGPFPYPPLTAFGAVPFTLFDVQTASVLVEAMLLVVVLGTIFVAGVRDWRCYGFALLWPPVIGAVETGNPTLWLALAAAVAWRCRDRLVAPAIAIGLSLAAKLFLWPLVVWLAAARRHRSAALSLLIGTSALLLSWAAIGFAGMLEYPGLLRRLNETVGGDAYTTFVVGSDLGIPEPLAWAMWMTIGLTLVVAVVLLARQGADRSAFILAIAASLALTPILWLHYFALLIVVIAVAQPTLGFLWFLPLGMIAVPGRGPTAFERSQILCIAAVTIGASLLTAMRAERRQAIRGVRSTRRRFSPDAPASAPSPYARGQAASSSGSSY